MYPRGAVSYLLCTSYRRPRHMTTASSLPTSAVSRYDKKLTCHLVISTTHADGLACDRVQYSLARTY
eukprot:1163493-Prymnesium_polylepis.1